MHTKHLYSKSEDAVLFPFQVYFISALGDDKHNDTS